MPTADAEPSIGTEPLAPVSENQPQGERAVSVLWSFGKCLGALLPVYLAGYYGFSVTIVLFGLVIYMGWKHGRQGKVMRLKSAMYLLENEKEFTTQTVFRAKRDLPPWVNFPDVEKVEWVNKILQQAWPFIGQYLEKLLVEIVAPAIRTSSIHLQTLSFTKVNIGDKALKVAGVKAHTENDKRQVMLDLYLSYAGDVEINVEIKKYFCKAGVKGVQLHGMLRVILEPLIGNVPLVGAVTMFFIRRPKLDINWTGLTNLLDIPGLNAMSDTMIMDAIASHLVLPNRLTIPLVADLHVAQLRSPLPRGVVRIHLLEAEELTAKDTVIKGLIDGKSDPYAVLRVGTQIFTSHHVDSNLNPQWREMYEVIVHEVPGQELEVEVFDKDPDQDDFLGRVKIDLDIVKKARVVDDWFDLRDVASGSVHLRLEWLSLLSSADRLSEVIAKNQNLTSKMVEPPSAAILAVYLDQAYQLPMRKGNKDPSPMVQISVQDKTKESKTCYGTTSPVWEDAFTFFIKDPHKQNIDIQVKDDDRALRLGSLKIPLARLVGMPELTMDQWFQLENSGSASRIFIKIVLRGVLRIHLVEAQNLIAKDNFMGGMMKGKSDPYVKIRVGGITFRSHTIKENLNPVWNELYELPGQEIQFELFDKDIDQDDFLGRFKLSLQDIISAQYTDTSLQSFQNKVVPSAALVFVYVERAHGLPEVACQNHVQCRSAERYNSECLQLSLKHSAVGDVPKLWNYECRNVPSGFDPPCTNIWKVQCNKIGAEIILKNVSYRSKISERSTSPRWDEGFHFLVSDPRSEILTVKLSHSWGQALGSLTLPLKEVLAETDLVLDRWLNLDGALPESQILLRVVLKVLQTGCLFSLCCSSFSWSNATLTGQVKLTIALVARSKDGADPYVSFILLPDKKATTKRKTATKKKDLSPEFNERFDFDLSLEESSQRRLDLSVKNSVSFISREKELIGKLQLDLDQIDLKTGVTQW
uniref:Extended synaptotagmin 1 n=1 Tax=Oreochromis niloticus TaxID=8128 RepID=I3K2H0_ORENI